MSGVDCYGRNKRTAEFFFGRAEQAKVWRGSQQLTGRASDRSDDSRAATDAFFGCVRIHRHHRRAVGALCFAHHPANSYRSGAVEKAASHRSKWPRSAEGERREGYTRRIKNHSTTPNCSRGDRIKRASFLRDLTLGQRNAVRSYIDRFLVFAHQSTEFAKDV